MKDYKMWSSSIKNPHNLFFNQVICRTMAEKEHYNNTQFKPTCGKESMLN